MTEDSSLDRFTRTAEIVTTDVTRTYSSSFGLATRLLGRRHRHHIRNIYAMARVADEIVDGVAGEAGVDERGRREALDAYAAETHRAMQSGYSTNIVLHAFARTARRCDIGPELTEPFFASMRTDADTGAGADQLKAFTRESHAEYVHGSAEVIGLMCLRVFLQDSTPDPADRAVMEHGAARLGAAFQNVNFLRDIADDTERLHRGYLTDTERLTDAERDTWLTIVREQLDDARRAIPLLPRDARAAVRTALLLFQAVADRVSRRPAAELYVRRVRVPDPMKVVLAGRAVLTTALERNR